MNDGQRVHVEERLRAGASQDELVQYLQSEGVDTDTATSAVAEVAAALDAPSDGARLPSISTLLQDSWRFVLLRTDLVGWYVVVSLVPIIAFALFGGLIILASETSMGLVGVAIALGLVLLAAVVWFMVTASAGLVYAVAQSGTEPIRFRTGWVWARSKFWQIVLVGFLTSLVIFSSALALVLPALIVFVYVAFYFLEFLRHDRHGLHALAASTHLVYGRFWSVAARLAVIIAIMAAINIGLTVAFGLDQAYATTASIVGEIFAAVVGFVFTVMFMRYLAQVHSALVATTAPYQPEPLSQSYKIYRVLAWIGGGLLLLLPISALLAVAGMAA
ncbi:MAG TPA: hypothetical protein VKP88_08480 [Candidatus Paceibacterota bacterium]|nr:hypothetical protein [Candidatus Paceibacterota bacterium]